MNPDPQAFARLVPGFEFLQSLGQKGAAGMTSGGFGPWIAPTLDPAELDKRIGELKTVQYWLEQNARVLATTIQALEVQRMTLATLKSMNVPLAEMAGSGAAGSAGVAAAGRKGRATGSTPAVDPLQWWGALTQQFGELASKVMTDATAAPSAAGAPTSTAAADAATKPAPRRKAAARRR